MSGIGPGLPARLIAQWVGKIIDNIGKDLTNNLTWKVWKSKHKFTKSQSDFLDRYAEAVLLLMDKDKPKPFLRFVGEESVVNIIYQYWVRDLDEIRFNQKLDGLAKHFTLYQQIPNISIKSEISSFLEILRSAVNLNRSASEAEFHGYLKDIKEILIDNIKVSLFPKPDNSNLLHLSDEKKWIDLLINQGDNIEIVLSNKNKAIAYLLESLTQFIQVNNKTQVPYKLVLGHSSFILPEYPYPGLYFKSMKTNSIQLIHKINLNTEDVLFIWLVYLAFKQNEITGLHEIIYKAPKDASAKLTNLQNRYFPALKLDESIVLEELKSPLLLPIYIAENIQNKKIKNNYSEKIALAKQSLKQENFKFLEPQINELINLVKNESDQIKLEVKLIELNWYLGTNNLIKAKSILEDIDLISLPNNEKLIVASIFLNLGEIKKAKQAISSINNVNETHIEINLAKKIIEIHFQYHDHIITGVPRQKIRVDLLKISDEIKKYNIKNKSLLFLLINIAKKIGDLNFAAIQLRNYEKHFSESIEFKHQAAIIYFYQLKYDYQRFPDRNLNKKQKKLIESQLSLLKECLSVAEQKNFICQIKPLKINLSSWLHLKASFSSGQVRKDMFKESAKYLDSLDSISISTEFSARLANAWLYSGETKRALEVFDSISFKLDDLDFNAQGNYVSALLFEGKIKKAINLTEKLIKQKNISWNILANIGIILFITGNPLLSITILNSAKKISKQDRWRINNLLGKAYSKLGDYRKAEDHLRTAIDQRSFDPSLYTEHFDYFQNGTSKELLYLCQKLEHIFKSKGVDISILSEFKEQINHALKIYKITILKNKSRKAKVDAQVTRIFSIALSATDTLRNKLNTIEELLSSRQIWSTLDFIEQIKDVLLNNYESVVIDSFNNQLIQKNDANVDKFRQIILGSNRFLEKVGIPVNLRINSIKVLHALSTPTKKVDNTGHTLNIMARIIEKEFSEPLKCYDYVANIKDRGYQRRLVYKVFNKMHGRAILADEVGLGKTIEAGLLLTEYFVRNLVQKCLILVPSADLKHQWYSELKQKFVLIKSQAVNLAKHGEKGWKDWDQHKVCILTYQAAVKNRNVLKSQKWDMVICDEAHKLKNRSRKSYKLIAKITSRYLLLLTATPYRKSLEDLYSLASLVRPSLFGTLKRFKTEYIVDIKGNIRNLTKLNSQLSQIMIRNTILGVGGELPNSRREFINPNINLTPSEINYYKEVITFILEEAKKAKNLPLYYYLLAREASSNPLTAQETLNKMNIVKNSEMREQFNDLAKAVKVNSKVIKVKDIINEVYPRKVLIFAGFKRTAIEIGKFLEIEVIHGGISPPKRRDIIERFKNSSEKKAIVVTPSQGEGLNLEFCSVIINFDLPWNPMTIEQRIGRIQRTGQKEKIIKIYSLASNGTIEQEIRDGLVNKVRVFEQVIGQIKLTLSSDELGKGIEANIYKIFKEAKDEKSLRESIAKFFEDQKEPLIVESNNFLDMVKPDSQVFIS